jgi:hypothetical protein
VAGVNTFLGAIGGKLAEAWMSLLVLPGLLFALLAAVGGVLGHRHALDTGLLASRVASLAADPASANTGVVVLVTGAALAASAGVGLLAAGLGRTVERLWLGDWPRLLERPARALTARRAARWHTAHTAYTDAVRSRVVRARDGDTAGDFAVERPDPAGTSPALLDRRNRIALVPPARPTWMGDRLHSLDHRVRDRYGLDLPSVWPRLWLLLPDAPRADLAAARTALATTARRAAWGLLCLAVGTYWWPAALVAAAAGLGAWRQGRLAAQEFAVLAESAVDLYGRELARVLGIPCAAQLTPEDGRKVTRLLRKGT